MVSREKDLSFPTQTLRPLVDAVNLSPFPKPADRYSLSAEELDRRYCILELMDTQVESKAEHRKVRQACGLYPLTDWCLIKATGKDVFSFLQSQTTNDVLQIDVHQGGVRLASAGRTASPRENCLPARLLAPPRR